jgi:hypothetical protein
VLTIIIYPNVLITDSGGRAVQVVGLKRLDCWERGFEFPCGHSSLLFVVCCVDSRICHELITCLEESHRVCVCMCVCVIVCVPILPVSDVRFSAFVMFCLRTMFHQFQFFCGMDKFNCQNGIFWKLSQSRRLLRFQYLMFNFVINLNV